MTHSSATPPGDRRKAGLATERGLWRDAYRELLRRRTVVVAIASVALFAVAMTIFGPLGTLETLRPLPRFAYWALCAALTFPLCYAAAAVALYLTRDRSLIEIVPAVVAAVLFEGLLCTAVVLAADLLFVPAQAPPLSALNTYLTVTVVVGACTFFAHSIVFVRISYAHAVTAAGPSAHGSGSPSEPRDAAPAAPVPGGSVPPHGAPRGGEPPLARRELPPRQARFYARLPSSVSRDVILLSMEDHYVNAHTTGGSCLIRMRFADAVGDLGTLGMQVHRSYWVARRHMLAVVRRDGRTMLRVTGGRHVPISRPYLPAVRNALRRRSAAT